MNFNYDAVIMLTFSIWKKEARSNRYHYASRFSKLCPVYFFQFDLKFRDNYFEKIKNSNIIIVHCNKKYLVSNNQHKLFNILKKIKTKKPLLWIYNYLLDHIIKNFKSDMKIFHATEDFFCSDLFFKPPNIDKLKKVLHNIDLLVSCSEGVNSSYIKNGYIGESMILTNGVDFDFYAPKTIDVKQVIQNRKNNIIFYQGGINDRLNMKLLYDLICKLSDMEFHFFGRSIFNDLENKKIWKSFFKFKNFKYHKFKSVEKLRTFGYKATMGIMPFAKTKYTVESAFPLKSFEYLACGLPVVSIEINSLKKFENLFFFANNAKEFEKQILIARTKSKNYDSFVEKINFAKKMDYNSSFSKLISSLN